MSGQCEAKPDIYMDYNATAPVRDEVLVILEHALRDTFGNPSSIHFTGRQAKKLLDESREKIATVLGARRSEIVFTGGGTESDNLAIRGIAAKHGSGHIITSSTEHPAVLETCRALEMEGFDVTYLAVDSDGRVDPERLREAIRDDTILVSIMWVNNETGVVQPIDELGAITRGKDVVFHSDAIQALGRQAIDVRRDPVDMVSITGHKICAPKGVGALYIRKGVMLDPLIRGGGQEWDVRSGTENVPGIAALGEACLLADSERDQEVPRLARFRDRLESGIRATIPKVVVNGGIAPRVTNTTNIRFTGADSEAVLLALDERRIAVSSASACAAGRVQSSHVLMAMGLSRREAEDSMRFSLGKYSRESDVDRCLVELPDIIDQVRKLR